MVSEVKLAKLFLRSAGDHTDVVMRFNTGEEAKEKWERDGGDLAEAVSTISSSSGSGALP